MCGESGDDPSDHNRSITFTAECNLCYLCKGGEASRVNIVHRFDER
jgi:hypothetical protein